MKEIEESKQERKEQEDEIRMKKAFEALKQYKNLKKGGFEITGKMKSDEMVDITGPYKNTFTLKERKEKDKEEKVKTTEKIIRGYTKEIREKIKKRIKIKGIKKNKMMQDLIIIKLGKEEEIKKKEKEKEKKRKERKLKNQIKRKKKKQRKKE